MMSNDGIARQFSLCVNFIFVSLFGFVVLSSFQTLSSFDQFSNMVLSEATERRIITVNTDGVRKNYFADIPLGMYIVRGDSMVLCGEVHNHWPLLEEVTLEELDKLQAQAEPSLEWEFDLDLTA
jgi:LSM domain